jgi:tRNA(Ile)-lysidine synthase
VERLRLHPEQKLMIAPDLTLARRGNGRVRKETVPRTAFDISQQVNLLQGEAGSLEFSGHRIGWERVATVPGASPNELRGKRVPGVEWFDADEVGRRIILRHWHPGDRFQPIGLPQPVKLQDLFTNLKVPREERRRRLLACTARQEIWWVEGLRIGEKFKVTSRTRARLKWQWAPCPDI